MGGVQIQLELNPDFQHLCADFMQSIWTGQNGGPGSASRTLASSRKLRRGLLGLGVEVIRGGCRKPIVSKYLFDVAELKPIAIGVW